MPDRRHVSSATFSNGPLAFLSLFQQQERSDITHTSGLSAPHCTTLLELPGRYLSIKIYCVSSRVRGEGSMCECVSSLTGLFQFALEDSAAAAAAA